MKMNDLKIGQYGYVEKMKTNGSPSKDPNAYLIRGAIIALRNEDILDVEVQGMKMCG
ncbi:MAG: hypothetical protein RR476_09280 [Cetobacterium sp.]